ncbi:MAG: methyltransferase domain-containing protein [Parvibaculum sp.]|uniref:methyltransferase domain-containing protein n=1 Tax=Parvibaculum sp. TaxID=2024848 RepID=UPI002728C9EA|nr:methyltransferase domain-containing protein [Parvibaculum sp.]MDO8840340.1 methyltransferase domain-containing protein [Parvibaculum sp.]
MTTWLHEQRLQAARAAVRESGATSVLDLGCGDGDLLIRLAAEPGIARIVGIDLCGDALGRLRARLDALAPKAVAEVDLVQGSMTDARASLAGFDCAVLIETIEHIEPDRLSVLERALFVVMRPATVIITTPNAEFNSLLGVPSHRFRHPGHRFEWDRAKFQRWAGGVAARNSYAVACRDIGDRHPALGGASQMAVFDLARRPGGRLAA